MKNRIISITLVLLMLIALPPVNAIAVDTQEPAATASTVEVNGEGVKVVKSARWIDQANGKAEITFTLSGDSETTTVVPATDIVLVIDKSGSMNSSNRLSNAKKAAKDFVDKFFGQNADPAYSGKIKIAVVTYNKDPQTVCGLTDVKRTLDNGIDRIRAEGGTNIQAGIHTAQEILRNGTGTKKIMVVLTDGAPTYSYKASSAASIAADQETYGVNKANFSNILSGFSYGSAIGCGAHYSLHTGQTDWMGYCAEVDGSYPIGSYKVSDNGLPTVSEAYAAKKSGTVIYGIGVGPTDDTVMKSVVTSSDHYYPVSDGDDAIDNAFNGIANSVTKAIVNDAAIVDQLGNNFTLSGTTETSKEWSMTGELKEEKSFTFEIDYDTDAVDGNAPIPTNKGAKLTYKTSDGEEKELLLNDSPTLDNPAKKVSYFDGYSEDGKTNLPAGYEDAYYWPGKEADVKAALSRQDYKFLGWEDASGTLHQPDEKIEVTGDVTLTAKWELDTIGITVTKEWDESVPAAERTSATVVLCDADGNPITGVNALVLNADNSFTGKFEGVPKSGTYSVKETYANDVAMTNGTGEVRGTNADNSTYLISTWTATVTSSENAFTVTNAKTDETTYSVSYKFEGEYPSDAQAPNGASGLYAGQDYQVSGTLSSNVTENAAGKRGSWSFDGWKRDGSDVTGTTIQITGNTELVGTWTFTEDPTYKVTYEFVAESGTLPQEVLGRKPQDTEKIYYTGTSVDAPDTPKANDTVVVWEGTWTFVGWDNDSITINGANGKFTGTWRFAANEYEVIYNFVGEAPAGATVPGPDTVHHGDNYQVAGTLTSDVKVNAAGKRGSWTFNGWYDNAALGGSKVTTIEITGSENLYGAWIFTEDTVYHASYRYVNGSADDGMELPENLPTLPTDTNDYYDGDTVIRAAAPLDGATVETADGTWTLSWNAGSLTIDGADVKFVGTWTYEEADSAEYLVTFYFQNADGTDYELDDSKTMTGTDAKVGKRKTIDPDNYPFSGYEYEKNDGEVLTIASISATKEDNVFKIYYKALPSVKVTKKADAADAEVGQTIWYTIKVENTGKRNLTNIVLEDVFENEDLVLESGEGYTVAHDEETNVWTITIDALNVGETLRITASYTVTADDEGQTITNKVQKANDDDDFIDDDGGESNVDVGEVEHHNADIIIQKTYTSNARTSIAATFYFDVYYEEDGEEVSLLDEPVSISFARNAARKDSPATKSVSVQLKDLDEETYQKLSELGVIYVRELTDEDLLVSHVTYDEEPVAGYIWNVELLAETDEEGEEEVFTPTFVIVSEQADYEALEEGGYNVFSFTNSYKKPNNGSTGTPAEVGPQLNRDDHVAYIMGYPDGTVHPEGQITRAEACTIFFRLLTEESRNYYFTKNNDYTDVSRANWYNNAISTLSNAGIVTGYNDGTFRPNQPITRAEMAKIIAGFANLNKGRKTFSDLDGHWSKNYVELAAGNGWIAGYPDGTFQPDKQITRAETVTMINRVLERVPAKESRLLSRSIMLIFPDNEPGEWYYIAIQEASNSHEYQRSVYESEGDEMWLKLRENIDWTPLER